MKKIIIIISLLLSFQFGAKAQWVTIPDAHFVAYLQANFPSCMNGNLMDTTCSGIISATTIDCANDSIADLTGIEYFHNLQTLTCSSNNLDSLPTLPNSIIDLDCSENQLTYIPSLPNSLQILFCNQNLLTSLPVLTNFVFLLDCSLNQLTNLPALPSMIQFLHCNQNQLTGLPSLPNSLLTLYSDDNHLTNLPTLSSSLNFLSVNNNQLTNLPILPNSLGVLECMGTLITSLPTLPNSLVRLNCSYNSITSLPTLPNSLTTLLCYNDSLTSLPTLPNSLTSLNCYNNQLTSLPDLPNTLSSFLCNNNLIGCMPLMPNSLTNPFGFNISGNPFTCLPNYVPAMNATTLTYPLCSSGNTNGCSVAQGIIGYTYKDNNTDCLYNVADSTKRNIVEKLYDGGNNLIGQTFSAMNGVYDFPIDTGSYTVMIDTLGMPFQVNCIYPGIDSTVVLTTASALQTNVNFSLTCKPGFDVGVQSVTEQGMVFPGQHHTLKVIAGDLSNWYNLHCAQAISGQVVISIVGPVTFDSVCTGALIPSIAGNVFTYTISDFGYNLYSSFGLALTTNSNALNGDSITVNVTVSPTSGDNNTTNNTYNYYYHVVNSYDPNYKQTYPEQVQPGFADYFTYTVHFQNTGSAAAINISLQDTLDANLDLNTFQVINYSHYCTSLLTGNKLSFNFPNIQLADSSTDFNGSQGFVQYRIKPLANLPAGTLIHNRASIYFDYNAPVFTNTTTNEFMLGVGVPSIIKASTISIYPNPSTGVFRIDAGNNKLKEIKVTDVLGRIVLVTNINSSNTAVDLSKETKGVYFIQLSDENNNRVNKKIIIE